MLERRVGECEEEGLKLNISGWLHLSDLWWNSHVIWFFKKSAWLMFWTDNSMFGVRSAVMHTGRCFTTVLACLNLGPGTFFSFITAWDNSTVPHPLGKGDKVTWGLESLFQTQVDRVLFFLKKCHHRKGVHSTLISNLTEKKLGMSGSKVPRTFYGGSVSVSAASSQGFSSPWSTMTWKCWVF